MKRSEKGGELDETVVKTAHVLAIDKAGRILTLLAPKKNVVDLEVGEEVRNFDQVKVGDQLRIEYYESAALYLGSPDPDQRYALHKVTRRVDLDRQLLQTCLLPFRPYRTA